MGDLPRSSSNAGAGASAARILDLVERTGCPLTSLSYLVLTHAHIDHVDGARFFRDCFPELGMGDQEALIRADPVRTAATWYGILLELVLCEEHYGIFEGKSAGTDFIRHQLRIQGL